MTDAATAVAVTRIAAGRAATADGYVRVQVDAGTWTGLARGCAAGLNDLSALWIDGGSVAMALNDPGGGVRAIVRLPLVELSYPSIGAHHAPALSPERSLRDLTGVVPIGLPDVRSWLDHGVWPNRAVAAARGVDIASTRYRFLPVEGEGLHQIPVGPVHAGIIEPGHFRFTANGEAVVRLEQRLGYVHKGIAALAVGRPIGEVQAIVARVSGDSTVAYGLGFARAVEAASGVGAPPRAERLRGVMAEIERIAHHVSDVGAICNDASVAAIHARCALVREDILQTTARVLGHRLMMDVVVPGGVTRDIDAAGITALTALISRVRDQFEPVVAIYDQMPSLQDRTVTTGIVSAELVRRFAAGGYVGRASGRLFDARQAFPYPPYDAIGVSVPTRITGDVDGRLWVRIEEVRQSLSLIARLLDGLPEGPILSAMPAPAAGEAASLVESFRGDAFVWLRIGADGHVAGLHVRDASVFQWPLLEAAIEGNIVADFPLCNKSFNCSYSGHDM